MSLQKCWVHKFSKISGPKKIRVNKLEGGIGFMGAEIYFVMFVASMLHATLQNCFPFF